MIGRKRRPLPLLSTRIRSEKLSTLVIAATRTAGGRIFFLGASAAGAGNATHAVNDFRKIAGIESYAPTDNVSELTARINDDGWESLFCRMASKEATFETLTRSASLRSEAVYRGEECQHEHRARPRAGPRTQSQNRRRMVGRDGGYTACVAVTLHVLIPVISPDTITPHTEAFQAVVWHLVVTHPRLKANEMKWESIR